ncbi:ABC transporter ATP-binding protein [Gallibacterium genomosp. 3]|uniref:ABC transporter ATP-binding protein n=1 Tax=Gallibacterium genomosp. 3 TaxID=505345 RepID=A0A1A7PQV6_9PAST|nr:ATP-binding cassette domain-containing protein [Gallibacterium genomosp. 3]OBX03535.1 ABC transporter ATP-binding protein [Gallibacterium genomosp. 3]
MLTLSRLKLNMQSDTIVQDFNLSLQYGEVKTLFGRSGCGKTTVLRLISGLTQPTSGKINNHFKKIGFLFQENRLLNHLNALQNITIFMPHPDLNSLYTLAEKVGLNRSDLNKYPSQLSGGMAKRIAFLRLLLSGCDLALLDEPFVGLDRDLRQVLIHILTDKIDQKQLACLLVTHDRFEAARLSHEILFLSNKGMNIENTICLTTPLIERDAKFEEKIVQQYFNEVIYYE